MRNVVSVVRQPFVVFEKYHKIFEDPVCDQAEAKIQESCRKVKAINPDTDCYIYTESDWARTEYSLGHWFNENPQNALQCPNPGDFPSRHRNRHKNNMKKWAWRQTVETQKQHEKIAENAGDSAAELQKSVTMEQTHTAST